MKTRISRRQFGSAAAVSALAAGVHGATAAVSEEQVLPGVWRYRYGVPERITPISTRHYGPNNAAVAQLPAVATSPLRADQITGAPSSRGYHVAMPLAAGELVYGLGLQFHSFLQRGRKKTLRVNADPTGDTGDSHAPVPFFVSTRGYGVLIDSARYVTVYCGNARLKNAEPAQVQSAETGKRTGLLPSAYDRFNINEPSQVLIEVPEAQGVDVYVFGGPEMRGVVQRYNLFAGGGPIPPRWGLGFWYRAYGGSDQKEILALAKDLRDRNIPCDVLGLEPGWQSHSYSCSFSWSDKFPAPAQMLTELNGSNFRPNLWEHAFTHRTSPIYKDLLPYAGNYEVWDGLVPDFLDRRAAEIFGGFHEEHLVKEGVAGFKLDECDNSDYTRGWSFPELSSFGSGADGEQMHCLFGLRYQDAIQSGFDNEKKRTWGLVRSSHALAAPYPYTLYSDLYDHREFIRAIPSASFCGLLWCPEVRDAKNEEDLIRRLQTVVLSPLAMVNAWYIRNPPWKQVDSSRNNAGQLASGWETLEAECRRWIELRMQLLPYLYAAFMRYHVSGVPPFRALVLDYPADAPTWVIDDQYLIGDALLFAPMVAGEAERSVYLPRGDWFDFWTGKRIHGGTTINVQTPLHEAPLFVKDGCLLPLATVTQHTADPRSYELTVRRYGQGSLETELYEEPAFSGTPLRTARLAWAAGHERGSIQSSGTSYSVRSWETVQG